MPVSRNLRGSPVVGFTLLQVLLFPGDSTLPAQSSGISAPCEQASSRVEGGKRWAAEKQYQRAIQEFRSALALCPENRGTMLELARAYLAARQFAEAEQTAKDYLAGDPSSEPGQFLLASSYFMQERFQEAGKLLQKLLAQNANNSEAHKLMGLTLFFYKEYVMAERELLVALRERPKDEEAMYYLGRIYYTQNNFLPAVRAFRRALALNPRSYKAYDNLGLCYQALGKTDEAIAAFKKAQELAREAAPAYDWPYANLAELLIQQNRAEEAFPYAQQAVRINPGSARNQCLIGKVLARKPDLQASIDHLRKATELDPNYAEPHYLLGQLYQKLGQGAEARHEFSVFEDVKRRSAKRTVTSDKPIGPLSD